MPTDNSAPSAKRALGIAMGACFVGVIGAILVLRAHAPVFLYDALVYWSGTQALAAGGDAYTAGSLHVRGLFTAFVYLPAHWASQNWSHEASAPAWAVLTQNAVMIALLSSVVIPLLIRRLVTLHWWHIVLTSGLGVLLLSGFAPYPLMDLPAVLFLALAVLLLSGRGVWAHLLGGVAAALALNLRPAYALPVGLLLLLTVVARRRRAPLALFGAAMTTGLQVVYGWAKTARLSIFGPLSSDISDIQLTYAAYGVRYDTVLGGADPRQWFCSPDMATSVGGEVPGSTGDLFGMFVSNLPESAQFAIDKVAASLLWTSRTPYADPGAQVLHPIGLLAAAVSCIGLVALIAVLRRREGASRMVALSLIAIMVGVAVTTVGSSPESRFALPIVVFGMVGSVAATAWWKSLVRPKRSTIAWVAVAIVVSVSVIALGWSALQHAAPPGDLTSEICQSI